MIIYDPGSFCESMFRWHGSVIKTIIVQLVLVTLTATGAAVWNQAIAPLKTLGSLEVGPIVLDSSGWSLMAFFVAFLLVFRNATCIARFNTGRNHLTRIAVASVELVRKCNFYVGAAERETEAAPEQSPETRRALMKQVFDLRRQVLALVAMIMSDLRDMPLNGKLGDDEQGWGYGASIIAGPTAKIVGGAYGTESDDRSYAHAWLVDQGLLGLEELRKLRALVDEAAEEARAGGGGKAAAARAANDASASCIMVCLSDLTHRFFRSCEIPKKDGPGATPEEGMDVLKERLLREIEKNIIALHAAYLDANEMVKVPLPFP